MGVQYKIGQQTNDRAVARAWWEGRNVPGCGNEGLRKDVMLFPEEAKCNVDEAKAFVFECANG